jgi:hypothetical protein
MALLRVVDRHPKAVLDAVRRLMMGRESDYFTLSLESLRAIGSWTADCAERALPVFEKQAALYSRPRAAIEGIREFASGARERS